MDETKWFRLLLVALTSIWFGAGGVWGYNVYHARRLESFAHEEYVKAAKIVDQCFAAHPDSHPGYCTDPGTDATLFSDRGDLSRVAANEYSARADVALWLAWLLPAALVLLF